jgi:PleD family two-component response regulator
MFQQAQRGDSRVNGGLGIGLTLVKHLLDMHGGKVAVQSAGPGQGSTFTIRLPLFDAPVIEDLPTLAVQRLDGVHLLLVGEEHDARSALEHLLTLGGARVTSADSQRAALEIETMSAFDVVVVDVSTAGIDGP